MAIFSKIKFYLKAIYVVGAVIVSTSYGVVAAILLSFIRRRGLTQYTTGRFFYYLARPILGIKFQFVGNDNYQKYLAPPPLLSMLFSDTPSFEASSFQRPCVIVSNHQSSLDVYMLGRLFPPFCSITSKKSLKYVPFLGWFMSLSGTVFLDRKNSAASVATLSAAGDNHLSRDRQSVFLFPEGTRSRSKVPKMLSPLKRGAFHIAIQAQIPVIPIVISNTSNLFDSVSKTINPGTIKVKVLDPIPTTGMGKEDVAGLADRVEELMKEAVEELGYSELDSEKSILGNDYSGSGDSSGKKDRSLQLPLLTPSRPSTPTVHELDGQTEEQQALLSESL